MVQHAQTRTHQIMLTAAQDLRAVVVLQAVILPQATHHAQVLQVHLHLHQRAAVVLQTSIARLQVAVTALHLQQEAAAVPAPAAAAHHLLPAVHQAVAHQAAAAVVAVADDSS